MSNELPTSEARLEKIRDHNTRFFCTGRVGNFPFREDINFLLLHIDKLEKQNSELRERNRILQYRDDYVTGCLT